MHDTGEFPPVDPIKVGLQGCCPRCGRGKLFDGFLKLKPRCSACGLDYAFADAGDGPAVFVMLIVGFLIIGLALWFDSVFAPPVWLHALIWLPLTVIVSLLLLRKFKGIMVALQYRNNASEGKIDHG
ncbi:DUF983 domain-containing protein [Agrobacterium tumefaciens]|jgi:uncharacterized protein (DUF983 family)|uniref:DUF983 domain-containing protein n=1 Tax=Agrobacterium cavarae TaxID=2528239 RepID=UPI000712CEFD|nr:DUF983 domain-containing protein [Agrobacterium cavarae]KQM35424.1 hypothetical protein ASE62_04025 [Rhizobium sp. Leaf202]KQN88160.1 hypothetical protein ASF03_04180 [Rhizobium sp. Leaf68]KQZ97474.1 hypothetical protein ASD74_09885 [Rhizobium sp. Root564]MDP9570161.1 uncharacterized protein (DUF983 family) [Agrobacterium larrymoorei]MQB20149.1 DUF983 domain-containing protein [Agrobacterium tumefaciens]